MKRYDKLVLLVLLLVFALAGFHTVSRALTPYVTFAYAADTERQVQVKGQVMPGSLVLYDNETFSFDMSDQEGTTVQVFSRGAVTSNLFEADSAVVVGRFEDGNFTANRILVKCPSKYEKAE